jgi:DNA-binding transcriptional LysR family regulator
MVIELRQLEYFIAVAEELHFGRAAARVHVTQPALSEQVRQMEESIGVPLLMRTTRSVRLTGPGRLFLMHARLILQQAIACVELTRLAHKGELGTDDVG